MADATRSRPAGPENDYDILSQIRPARQDASFSGMNLIYGDSLKMVFNEKSTAPCSVAGVTFTAAGLGLA